MKRFVPGDLERLLKKLSELVNSKQITNEQLLLQISEDFGVSLAELERYLEHNPLTSEDPTLADLIEECVKTTNNQGRD
jgi:coproporphyrinogen III oxidase-like Fe-S oxidoreductase